MAFLTIGGVTARVGAFRRLEDERAGGEQRTLSGSLRGGPLWTKRAWEVESFTVSDVDAATLRAAISAYAAVNVTGDAVGGGTVSCRVRITNEDVFARSATKRTHKFSLSLREA